MNFISQKILVVSRESHYIKSLLVEFSLGKYKILRRHKLHFQSDFPEDNLEEAKPLETGNSVEVIINFLATHYPEEKELVFLLGNDEIFIRNITLPVTRENLVFQILPSEIEAYLPFPVEEMQVLGNIYKIEEEARVLSLSAKNETVESYILAFSGHNYDLKMLGIESVALAEAISLLPEEEYRENSILQLDIGYYRTLINIVTDGKLAFTRQIPWGVDTLLSALENHRKKNISTYDMQDFVFKKFLYFFTDEDFSEASYFFRNVEGARKTIQELLGAFQKEMERSILVSGVSALQSCYLSGDGAFLYGIENVLEKMLPFPVKKYQYRIDGEPAEPWLSLLGGFFHFQKGRKKIDFLNTPLGKSLKRKEIQLRVFLFPAIFLSISLFLLIAAFSVNIVLESRQLRYYQGKLQEVAVSLQEIGNTPNPVPRARKLCEEKLNSWRNAVVGPKFLEIIKEIDEHIPAPDVVKTEFRGLRYSEDQITLEIIVDSLSNVVKVQEELQKSRMFTTVEVVRRDLIAGQKVRLELSLKIKPAQVTSDITCR